MRGGGKKEQLKVENEVGSDGLRVKLDIDKSIPL